MARFETFERDIKVATAGLEPRAINAALAAFARKELASVIASGQASTNYERFVNGVRGAPESAVQAPGPILYEFVNWPLLIRAALDALVAASPKRSGRYAGGFMVLAGGRPVREFSEIPTNAEVIIFNVRPYTRKIEVGAMKMSVPPRHFDRARGVVSRRFGRAFRFETRFVNIGGGLHPDVLYRLKRTRGRRKDRQAGSVLTYPALVINPVT